MTGELTGEERAAQVEALADSERRLLIATDCLSEGVNLQGSFDAVVHYDLSWNPTRHEQREGRVDRFGQPNKIVRATLMYGDNNPVAGQPQSGIWFGKTDDLWSWGKPQGWGGPWRRAAIKAGEASDPFLMTGFDRKVLHVKSDKPAEFEVQIDFLGGGDWVTYETLKTGADGYRYHAFPAGFSAHWVRIVPKTTCTASAEFIYT